MNLKTTTMKEQDYVSRKEFTRVNPQNPRTLALQAKMLADHKLELTDEQIGNKYGYSTARVKELLKTVR